MFTAAYRDTVRDRVLQLATTDPRVVAGAVIGSLALSDGDEWSDLDLTFATKDSASAAAVLSSFSDILAAEFNAVRLFDLPSGTSIYRVFLLPGCLQVDLSFTPAADFGALGLKFRLLFGTSVNRPYPQEPEPTHLLGYAVHHAVRARVCIERGRYLQAEYWISAVRDYGLSLACCRSDLPASYGRGFDDLPKDVRDASIAALVVSLDREELDRALRAAISALVREAEAVPGFAGVVPQLLELANPSGPR